MKMAIVTAHAGAECLSAAFESWMLDPHVGGAIVAHGRDGILPAYELAWKGLENQDIIAYLHDDLILKDPDWSSKVLREFHDPSVGLVGFGGAMGGIVFGEIVGQMLKHGFGYAPVFAAAGTLHVLAFLLVLVSIRKVQALTSPPSTEPLPVSNAKTTSA